MASRENDTAFRTFLDGKRGVFALRRDDGHGDYDLWFFHQEVDGEFGQCNHAGTQINSAASDLDPTMTADGLLLVVSSNRGGQPTLWTASRTGIDQPFSEATSLELGGAIKTHWGFKTAMLSGDGRLLVFGARCPATLTPICSTLSVIHETNPLALHNPSASRLTSRSRRLV